MRIGENIYKRKDGRWEGRIKNGYDNNGKVKYKSMYGKTYSQVKEKLINFVKNDNSQSLQKIITLATAFELYINSIKFSNKQSTISTYNRIYYKHLSPTFCGSRLPEIHSNLINSFITEKLEQGLSHKYVNDIVILLFAIINFSRKQKYAVHDEFNIIKIKSISKEIQSFNEQEQRAIESHALTHMSPVTACILLSLNTGIRLGELCALKIGDIDFKSRTIIINKTMQRIKNLDKQTATKTKIVIDTPKSKSSIRVIPIPEFLLDILRNLTHGSSKSSYLTTNDVYKFIEPRLLEYKFTSILEYCKVEYKNFHVLRHTFATNSIVNGYLDIKSLSEILGHCNVNITLGKYVHSNIEIKHAQMKNLNNAFISRHFIGQNKTENMICQDI